MILPKLNVALARKVKRHILAEPKRLNMSFWMGDVIGNIGVPPCGTQACIAGWACLLSVPKNKRREIITKEKKYHFNPSTVGQKKLGLTKNEADILFGEFNEATGKKGAKEASRKIDALVAARKKGEEFLGLS
jgi:hypothetical protein